MRMLLMCLLADEWQAVKEGQAIPPGLHVQIDMQTGEKRARLIPAEERVGVQPASRQQSEDTRDVLERLAQQVSEAKAKARTPQHEEHLSVLSASFARWIRSANDLVGGNAQSTD